MDFLTPKRGFLTQKQGFLTQKQGFLTQKQGFLTPKQEIISKLISKQFLRVRKDRIFPNFENQTIPKLAKTKSLEIPSNAGP